MRIDVLCTCAYLILSKVLTLELARSFTVSWVLHIRVGRNQWISIPDGYPPGLDMGMILCPWFFFVDG